MCDVVVFHISHCCYCGQLCLLELIRNFTKKLAQRSSHPPSYKYRVIISRRFYCYLGRYPCVTIVRASCFCFTCVYNFVKIKRTVFSYWWCLEGLLGTFIISYKLISTRKQTSWTEHTHARTILTTMYFIPMFSPQLVVQPQFIHLGSSATTATSVKGAHQAKVIPRQVSDLKCPPPSYVSSFCQLF